MGWHYIHINFSPIWLLLLACWTSMTSMVALHLVSRSHSFLCEEPLPYQYSKPQNQNVSPLPRAKPRCAPSNNSHTLRCSTSIVLTSSLFVCLNSVHILLLANIIFMNAHGHCTCPPCRSLWPLPPAQHPHHRKFILEDFSVSLLPYFPKQES